MDTQGAWKALGAAMREAASEADMTQDDVGAAVAKAVGRERPFDQALVSKWYRGVAPPQPDQLIAFEKIVGADPGSYTRHLGYLPLGVVPVLTVPEAIATDVQLTKRQSDNLSALWRAEVETTLAQRASANCGHPHRSRLAGKGSTPDPPHRPVVPVSPVGAEDGRSGRRRRPPHA